MQTLEAEIEKLKQDLKIKQSELDNIQRYCSHEWNVTYEPEYREAYTIPGDTPGTMGVDWQGPLHVPSETIKKWARTCPKCGLKQETQRTKKYSVQGTTPGTSGEINEPVF